MLVISGKCGNYISFSDTDEVENMIENLKKMMDTGEKVLLYGWSSDKTPDGEFDKEYKLIKEMFENDFLVRLSGKSG